MKGREHSEDLGIDGNVVLECILRKLGGELRTGCIWLGIWATVGLL